MVIFHTALAMVNIICVIFVLYTWNKCTLVTKEDFPKLYKNNKRIVLFNILLAIFNTILTIIYYIK